MFNSNPDNPPCKHCQSKSVRKNGFFLPSKTHPDRPIAQRYRCNDCGKSFTIEDLPRYVGERAVTNGEKSKKWREGKVKDFPPIQLPAQ
jgi:transposase-like protein